MHRKAHAGCRDHQYQQDDHAICLLSPKVLEPCRRRLGVAHRMLDVAVTEIRLERPRIMPSVGQCVSASMPQHVRVSLKAKPSLDPGPLHQAGEPGSGERRPTLRRKYERRFGLLLALEPPQRPQLIAEDRMAAGSARLDSADVQDRGFEVDLIPPHVHQLGCPQPMPVGDKDHGAVPVPPTVAPDGSHKPLDLGLGQVFAGAQVAVGAAPGRNCSIYDSWLDQPEMPFRHDFGPPRPSNWSYNAHFPTSSDQPKPGLDLFTCGVLTHAAEIDVRQLAVSYPEQLNVRFRG